MMTMRTTENDHDNDDDDEMRCRCCSWLHLPVYVEEIEKPLEEARSHFCQLYSRFHQIDKGKGNPNQPLNIWTWVSKIEDTLQELQMLSRWLSVSSLTLNVTIHNILYSTYR